MEERPEERRDYEEEREKKGTRTIQTHPIGSLCCNGVVPQFSTVHTLRHCLSTLFIVCACVHVSLIPCSLPGFITSQIHQEGNSKPLPAEVLEVPFNHQVPLLTVQ